MSSRFFVGPTCAGTAAANQRRIVFLAPLRWHSRGEVGASFFSRHPGPAQPLRNVSVICFFPRPSARRSRCEVCASSAFYRPLCAGTTATERERYLCFSSPALRRHSCREVRVSSRFPGRPAPTQLPRSASVISCFLAPPAPAQPLRSMSVISVFSRPSRAGVAAAKYECHLFFLGSLATAQPLRSVCVISFFSPPLRRHSRCEV